MCCSRKTNYILSLFALFHCARREGQDYLDYRESVGHLLSDKT